MTVANKSGYPSLFTSATLSCPGINVVVLSVYNPFTALKPFRVSPLSVEKTS